MATEGGPDIVTNGLVLSLDAGNKKSYPTSGTLWRDLSGNGNNGTLINGPTFDSGNNGSLVFDGINDYTTIDTTVGSGDFTFNIWLRRQSTSTSASFLFGRYADSVERGCMFYILNNILSFRIAAAVSGDRTVNMTSTVTGSNWTNVVASATRTSNVLLYRDGVFDVQTNISSQQGNIPTLRYIGTANGGIWFLNANVGIVQVYNRALTANEIIQNYNATKGRFGL
jgi:hypothetical protein